MKTFLEEMQFRHACKAFDTKKKIPADEFQKILEFGRLSPSSFGMEQWRFKVIETKSVRQKLKKACWDQPQITEASHVIVICAITEDIKPGADYVKQLFERRNMPEEATEAYIGKYAEHNKQEVIPYMNTFAWSAKQCYLALANMMTGAASLGIDSCPIEGFEKAAVEKVLSIDTDKEEVAVVLTLGYRAGEQTPAFRQELEKLVSYY